MMKRWVALTLLLCCVTVCIPALALQATTDMDITELLGTEQFYGVRWNPKEPHELNAYPATSTLYIQILVPHEKISLVKDAPTRTKFVPLLYTADSSSQPIEPTKIRMRNWSSEQEAEEWLDECIARNSAFRNMTRDARACMDASDVYDVTYSKVSLWETSPQFTVVLDGLTDDDTRPVRYRISAFPLSPNGEDQQPLHQGSPEPTPAFPEDIPTVSLSHEDITPEQPADPAPISTPEPTPLPTVTEDAAQEILENLVRLGYLPSRYLSYVSVAEKNKKSVELNEYILAAIARFAHDHGTPSDAIDNKLRQELRSADVPTSSLMLDVTEALRKLRFLGVEPNDKLVLADGSPTEILSEAIQSFQSENPDGLPSADGQVTLALLYALDDALLSASSADENAHAYSPVVIKSTEPASLFLTEARPIAFYGSAEPGQQLAVCYSCSALDGSELQLDTIPVSEDGEWQYTLTPIMLKLLFQEESSELIFSYASVDAPAYDTHRYIRYSPSPDILLSASAYYGHGDTLYVQGQTSPFLSVATADGSVETFSDRQGYFQIAIPEARREEQITLILDHQAQHPQQLQVLEVKSKALIPFLQALPDFSLPVLAALCLALALLLFLLRSRSSGMKASPAPLQRVSPSGHTDTDSTVIITDGNRQKGGSKRG